MASPGGPGALPAAVAQVSAPSSVSRARTAQRRRRVIVGAGGPAPGWSCATAGSPAPSRGARWPPSWTVARAAACMLADEGLVVVTRRGVTVDGRTAPGPVRVRLVAGAGHPGTPDDVAPSTAVAPV